MVEVVVKSSLKISEALHDVVTHSLSMPVRSGLCKLRPYSEEEECLKSAELVLK